MNLVCLGELAITIVSNQTTFYELCRPRPRAEVNQSLHQSFISWEWAVPNRQLQFLKNIITTNKYLYDVLIFVLKNYNDAVVILNKMKLSGSRHLAEV